MAGGALPNSTPRAGVPVDASRNSSDIGQELTDVRAIMRRTKVVLDENLGLNCASRKLNNFRNLWRGRRVGTCPRRASTSVGTQRYQLVLTGASALFVRRLDGPQWVQCIPAIIASDVLHFIGSFMAVRGHFPVCPRGLTRDLELRFPALAQLRHSDFGSHHIFTGLQLLIVAPKEVLTTPLATFTNPESLLSKRLESFTKRLDIGLQDVALPRLDLYCILWASWALDLRTRRLSTTGNQKGKKENRPH